MIDVCTIDDQAVELRCARENCGFVQKGTKDAHFPSFRVLATIMQTLVVLLGFLVPPSAAQNLINRVRRIEEVSSGDPSSWCTSAEFAEWNCDCSGLKDGVGIIKSCLIDEVCNKCNNPDSCLRAEAEATVQGPDRYTLDLCYMFDGDWKMCLGSETDSGLLEKTCVFNRGEDELCCDPDDAKSNSCGAEFCDASSEGWEGVVMCDLLESDCPLLEDLPTSPPAEGPAPVANSPTAAAPSAPVAIKPTVAAPSAPVAIKPTVAAPSTMKPTGVGRTTVDWPANFPNCDVNATDECGIADFDSKISMWYTIVGNGNLLKLSPLCNDDLGNMTMSILSGDDCDGLKCLFPPQILDMSCSSLGGRDRRILETAEPFDFQTRLDVLYWIFLNGPPSSLLFEEFPFGILEKGIPPSESPSNQPSAMPSVTASPSASAVPTTFTGRPSTTPSQLPSGLSLSPTLSISDVPSGMPTEDTITQSPSILGNRSPSSDEDDNVSSDKRMADGEDGGLSTGALVGIILGVLLLLCCCFFLFFVLNQRRRGKDHEVMPIDEESVDMERRNLAFNDEHYEVEGHEDYDESDDEDDENEDDDDRKDYSKSSRQW